jgi:hypothetical protein
MYICNIKIINMSLTALSMGLGLGSQALQLINSIQQLKASSDIAKNNTRPNYEIPEAVTESLNLSRRNASMTELPGQSTMEARMGSTVSGAVGQGIKGASSQANLLDFIGKQYNTQQEGMQNIGMQAAQQWNNNQVALKNDLNNYGAYQEKQWNLNKYEPYQVAAAKAAALQKAGTEGLVNSVGGIGGIVGQFDINQATNKYYDDQIANQKKIIENMFRNNNNGGQQIVGNIPPDQDPNSDAGFTSINPNYIDWNAIMNGNTPLPSFKR